jgi:two-component system, LytTR family, response regulator
MSYTLQQQSLENTMGIRQNQSKMEVLYQELHSCKRTLEDLLTRQLNVQERSFLKKMLVKSNGRLIIVNTDDIDWIEAWGDYIRLHCKGKTHILRQKVGDVETKLDPKQFLRIGRSAIVNVDRIKELESLNHGDYIITLSDATQLNLSRYYRDRVIALFGSHL